MHVEEDNSIGATKGDILLCYNRITHGVIELIITPIMGKYFIGVQWKCHGFIESWIRLGRSGNTLFKLMCSQMNFNWFSGDFHQGKELHLGGGGGGGGERRD